MATLGSPSPPSSPSPSRRRRHWARRVERLCCNIIVYFPLAFVYGVTTWAVYTEVNIGSRPSKAWAGSFSSAIGVIFYSLLNWSYTTAVFTDPGSPLATNDGYSHLPSQEAPRAYTSFTVKSTGDIRYCKKCQTKKPDRAHHCSTCRRCVLKMDHHCPWLATCVGLRNYKAFVLFLVYLSIFCWICFVVSASWVWAEVLSDGRYTDTMLPVSYVLLAVISGIIGVVITGFTSWHIYLAGTGTTTIEKLEKTRYLSPLKRTVQHSLSQRNPVDPETGRPSISDQLREIHANAIPGITRPEEGEERLSPPPSHFSSQSHLQTPGSSDSSPAQRSLRQNYGDFEAQRERDRYAEYLEEKDSEGLPHAFDLGWRRNLRHLFGPSPWLWALPICNTTGDGWQWEPSPKWLQARDSARRTREAEVRAQKDRERAAGWGSPESPTFNHQHHGGGGRPAGASPGHRPSWYGYANARESPDSRCLTTTTGVTAVPVSGRRSPSKADQLLGRRPGSSPPFTDGPIAEGTQLQVLGRSSRASATPPPRRAGGAAGGRASPASTSTDEYDTSSDEGDAEPADAAARRPLVGSAAPHSGRPAPGHRQGSAGPHVPATAAAGDWNDVPSEMLGRGVRRGAGASQSRSRERRGG